MSHKSDTLKVALIQTCSHPTIEQSLDALQKQIREAAQAGAQLVLLPELHNTPYFPYVENSDYFDLAETIPGPSTRYFSQLASELNIVIVCSLFEKRAKGLYHNTAVVLEKTGEIAGIYRKMHIPDDPGYYEKYYFTPGDLGFEPIHTSVGTLGVLVCWDQWYPEAARLMALKGADILLYPTAIGWDPQDTQDEQNRQLDAWITSQRAHAIANGLPVLACNRIGIENQTPFWGNSFIVGPQGEFLARADAQSQKILLCEIALHNTEKVRRAWPFLRDRRIDAYDNLTKRYIKGSGVL